MACLNQIVYVVMVDNNFNAMTVTKRKRGPKPQYGLTASMLRKSRRDCGMLYRLIRAKLGITQVAMAALMGCSKDALVRREHTKRLYTVIELQALKDISGMTDSEWLELLREIAK